MNKFTVKRSMTIGQIADAVHANAVNKGFHPLAEEEHAYIEQSLNNLHDELSELHQAYRNGDFHKQCDKPCVLTCAEEETADIVIRVFDFCRQLNIDIARAIEVKHAYNLTRPHRHGGKLS